MTREEWRRHMVELRKVHRIVDGIRPYISHVDDLQVNADDAEWDEPEERARAVADYRAVLTRTLAEIRMDLAKLDEADAILAGLEVAP
jgi:hypothetical protein